MFESTQIQDMRMNNKRAQSFMDPLAQSKIARLEGTTGSTAAPGFLPKADKVPQYSQEKSLPYRRAYMSCALSGPESLEFPSPWSPSRTCVRNGESPVVQHSATQGSITNQVFYRHENVAFPLDGGSSAAADELAVKHNLPYCTRSPSKHSPTATGMSPVAFNSRRHLSPSLAENTVGLAVPKPVYGHSPCCADRKCPIGHNYGLERGGLQRVQHSQMPEDDWASQYGHWAYLQKREQELLMQQRMMPLEHRGERVPLKDVTTEGFHGHSPSHPSGSAFTEPRQTGYRYCPAGSHVPSSPEHCQRFQLSPQGHKDPPTMYDPLTRTHYRMPTRVYQDRTHISRYPEMPQHPLPYYPHNNTHVYRSDHLHLTLDKQATGSCPVPQPYFSNLTNPYTVVHPSHMAVRNLSPYRMRLNAGHMNMLNDRPCQPSTTQLSDRPLDFSMRRQQHVDAPREPHSQMGISRTFYQEQCRVPNHVVAENSTYHCSNQGINGFPVGDSHDYSTTPRGTNSMFNRKQIVDPMADHTLHSKGPRLENSDGCDVTNVKKASEMDLKKTDETRPLPSPPMPVINKVFSLAPYKAYLEAAGMLSPAQDPQKPEVQVDSKPHNEESEQENTDSKAHLGLDRLKVEPVKTPPTSSHDSVEKNMVKIKKEKTELDEVPCQAEIESPSPALSQNFDNVKVKEEPADMESPVYEHNLVIVKSDYEAECKSVTPEMPEPEPSPECKPEPDVIDTVENLPTQTGTTDSPLPLPPESQTPPQTTFSFSRIPPQCLKLSSFEIIVPEKLKAPMPSVPSVVLQSPVESEPAVISNRQARHLFMELHQSLCKLLSDSVSQTSNWELKNWLSRLDLKAISSTAKTQKVSCLLGLKAREVWLKSEETVTLLKKVLGQLEKYVRCRSCPFPYVIRAGTLFVPMLVVKEILFPQVQGTFIDQVLQEHRVELRPTTLSEERHLTQLHRRTFSSKLRRLLALKYLPDIYPDVLNILYYTVVCKFLGLEFNSPLERHFVEFTDEAESSLKALECVRKHKRKSRVKRACRRMFLGEESSSNEDDAPAPALAPPPEPERWCFSSSLDGGEWVREPADCSEQQGHVQVKIEEDDMEAEMTWRRPLTSADFSSDASDASELASCLFRHDDGQHCGFSQRRPGMVLKLRKVYHPDRRRGRVPHYQRVTDHHHHRERRHTGRGDGTTRPQRGTRGEDDDEELDDDERSGYRMRHKERKLSPEQRRSRCARHSKRRRWMLRSAVRNTREAEYPDLVGKRIRHLYEENDKTEVWYRGVVLRVHEPHHNPLKTVFEVQYDSEPEWQYYLELLLDYQKGWLKIDD